MFHTFCLFQNGFVFRKGTIIDETTHFGSIARHRRRLGSVDMSASQTFESSPITTSIRILLLSYDKCDDDENDDERKKEKKTDDVSWKKKSCRRDCGMILHFFFQFRTATTMMAAIAAATVAAATYPAVRRRCSASS